MAGQATETFLKGHNEAAGAVVTVYKGAGRIFRKIDVT
jgi:hypothetical protein